MGLMGGKVAVRTGGVNGIGRAYCHGIAKEGGAVVVADINGAAAEGVAKAIADSGGKVSSVQVDVANSASCQEMAKKALDSFGRIDGLINNAAIFMSVPVTKSGWQTSTSRSGIRSWPSMSKGWHRALFIIGPEHVRHRSDYLG